jgi:hypothetical protein
MPRTIAGREARATLVWSFIACSMNTGVEPFCIDVALCIVFEEFIRIIIGS